MQAVCRRAIGPHAASSAARHAWQDRQPTDLDLLLLNLSLPVQCHRHPHHHARRPYHTHRAVSTSTNRRSQAAAAAAAQQIIMPSPSPPSTAPTHGRPLAKLPTLSVLRGLALLSIMSQPRVMALATAFVRRNIALLAGNPLSRAVLDAAFYWHFCAGATRAEIEATCAQLRGMGFAGVIAMYAREVAAESNGSAPTEEEHARLVDEWAAGALQTIACVARGDFVALKLTGAGPAVVRALEEGRTEPDAVMRRALSAVCDAAVRKG
ncbi:proline dehydrogenase, partial [Ascosphaera acerosa]